MAEMKYDLENAQSELVQVRSLLEIFQEFYIEECPDMNKDNPPEWTLASFAGRMYQYMSLIRASLDKLNELIEGMETAIERA